MKKNFKKASIAALAGIMAAAAPFTVMASEQTTATAATSEQTEISTEVTDEEIEAFIDSLIAAFDEETTDSDYSTNSNYSLDTIDEAEIEQGILDILDQIGTEIENALSEEQIQRINDAFDNLLNGVADHTEVFLNELVEVFNEVSANMGLTEDDASYFEMSEEEEAVWSQMSIVYDELDALEATNIDTWKKLYQNTTVDDIDEDFDESAFILKSDDLTTAEKEALLDQIEQEDTYQSQLSELQDELSALYDTDYSGGTSDEEQASWNRILSFYNRAYAIRQTNADLWGTIDDALNESDDYLADTSDMTAFINGLDTLTNEEKTAAITDNNLVDIFNKQAEILTDSILGDVTEEASDASNAVG